MFQKNDSFFFIKKHICRARDFYDMHGKYTVFLSNFLRVIMTFAPLAAGNHKNVVYVFSLNNCLGIICRVMVMNLSGYCLQTFVLKKNGFDMKERIDYIPPVIIIVPTLPD
ncbi:DedA family protein [Flavisolibacter nicotianae]|uniref:DedA family protein n=1 Tax=Flavisolibacter nicotianae TaxID=2364882 RepID=UPI0013C4087A|nr:hypothetical protein [Flavisolibacter nicotianae]